MDDNETTDETILTVAGFELRGWRATAAVYALVALLIAIGFALGRAW